jgi:hypothetical protein
MDGGVNDGSTARIGTGRKGKEESMTKGEL